MITDKYTSLKAIHEKDAVQLKTKSLTISLLRLTFGISFLVVFYYFINNGNKLLLGASILFATIFFILIKLQRKVAAKRRINTQLININQDELNFLNNNELNFNDGSAYIDHTHSYAYDLDIFGAKSLFQTLNRTASYIGETKLANALLNVLPQQTIQQNQEAIKELADKLEWRQNIYAFSKATEDSKEIYEKLINWSKKEIKKPSLLLVILSFVSPVIFAGVFLTYLFTDYAYVGDASLYLFLFNLMLVGSQLKHIKHEIIDASKINEILNNYSLIIQQVENETFTSKKLNQLQKSLNSEGELASAQIRNLSKLFAQLDNIANPLGAALFNGSTLYHLHTLRSLYKWKTDHHTKITTWLDIIGEIETLNSLANFAYNNNEFTYPELNNDFNISCTDLGHPLINKEVRINNDIDFSKENFIILTGSNMSGKSTFLRSLGINMVLAGIGSPICAKQAYIHPLDICVSMRLSDSLSDNESYFFAEVKRLKEIMDKADQKISFVLLDEILRGTNSDDKRNGTVEVIKKIIAKKAIGAIATHDLKVCDITKDYPDTLSNKCFEVEIINNDLAFDYKLRDGVCKNKSATFLMKKMEVI